MRFLIIDDNPGDLLLLQEYVGHGISRYEFVAAKSGEQGLMLARENVPDLAVIDVRLPGGMDGYEACRRIKEFDPTIKVLIVTGNVGALNEVQAVAAGADKFCVKNFDYQFMAHVIKEMMMTE